MDTDCVPLDFLQECILELPGSLVPKAVSISPVIEEICESETFWRDRSKKMGFSYTTPEEAQEKIRKANNIQSESPYLSKFFLPFSDTLLNVVDYKNTSDGLLVLVQERSIHPLNPQYRRILFTPRSCEQSIYGPVAYSLKQRFKHRITNYMESTHPRCGKSGIVKSSEVLTETKDFKTWNCFNGLLINMITNSLPRSKQMCIEWTTGTRNIQFEKYLESLCTERDWIFSIKGTLEQPIVIIATSAYTSRIHIGTEKMIDLAVISPIDVFYCKETQCLAYTSFDDIIHLISGNTEFTISSSVRHKSSTILHLSSTHIWYYETLPNTKSTHVMRSAMQFQEVEKIAAFDYKTDLCCDGKMIYGYTACAGTLTIIPIETAKPISYDLYYTSYSRKDDDLYSNHISVSADGLLVRLEKAEYMLLEF